MPPEKQAEMEMAFSDENAGFGLSNDKLRQIYFEKAQSGDPKWDRELVSLVLDRARRVISHPSRPKLRKVENFLTNPFGELALEESIEESPLLAMPEDFLVEEVVDKPFSCVAMLDTSSSMNGEKHLLASIAVAVLLLEVKPPDASVVLFSSKAQSIKSLSTQESVADTVLKFLKARPRGFTNIRLGLEHGIKQYQMTASGKRKVGLLASDGRSTEGGDVLEIARQFDFLLVLHLHGAGSHIEASREMAEAGSGVCLEVEDFSELPNRLYDAIRLLARI